MSQFQNDPMDSRITWLRDHLMVLDESEPETYENLMEACVGVIEAAWADTEASEQTKQAVADLKRALRYRKGVGSALRKEDDSDSADAT